jgi:L-galactose dehydrogenase
LGLNYFDTAPFYGLGRSEIELGRGLAGVPRETYCVATKVGRYGLEDFDFSAARVTASIDQSLARLGLDHVDLLQVHDLEYGDLNQIVEETLPALFALREAGKCRFVGITGLPLVIFSRVLSRCQVDTILSYAHYTLADNSLEALLPYFAEHGVGVINASPLAQGLLTAQGPPDWHVADPALRAGCRRATAWCAEQGLDPARLALWFSLAEPRLATNLVSTARPANLARNVAWAEEQPDWEVVAQLREVLAPIHNWSWPTGRIENN